MICLVPGWKKLYKWWSVQVALIGLALPEVLSMIADNSHLLPWLDDEVKSAIRVGCLVAVPLVRAIQQRSLAP